MSSNNSTSDLEQNLTISLKDNPDCIIDFRNLVDGASYGISLDAYDNKSGFILENGVNIKRFYGNSSSSNIPATPTLPGEYSLGDFFTLNIPNFSNVNGTKFHDTGSSLPVFSVNFTIKNYLRAKGFTVANEPIWQSSSYSKPKNIVFTHPTQNTEFHIVYDSVQLGLSYAFFINGTRIDRYNAGTNITFQGDDLVINIPFLSGKSTLISYGFNAFRIAIAEPIALTFTNTRLIIDGEPVWDFGDIITTYNVDTNAPFDIQVYYEGYQYITAAYTRGLQFLVAALYSNLGKDDNEGDPEIVARCELTGLIEVPSVSFSLSLNHISKTVSGDSCSIQTHIKGFSITGLPENAQGVIMKFCIQNSDASFKVIARADRDLIGSYVDTFDLVVLVPASAGIVSIISVALLFADAL